MRLGHSLFRQNTSERAYRDSQRSVERGSSLTTTALKLSGGLRLRTTLDGGLYRRSVRLTSTTETHIGLEHLGVLCELLGELLRGLLHARIRGLTKNVS